MESRQGLILGTTATRAGGGSCLRPPARKTLPSCGAVPQMANGQEAQRLHLLPARSHTAARTGSDFSLRSIGLSHRLSIIVGYFFSCVLAAIHGWDRHR